MKKRISKKKLIIFFLIVVLFFLLLLGGYFFLVRKNTIDNILYFRSELTIEAGDNVPTLNDYLYKKMSSYKEIVWDNLEIVDGKAYCVGTYQGKFNYDNKEKHIKLIIKDTTPPVIEGVKDIEMLAYEKVPNLLDGVTVTDNSNEELTPKIEGNYDTEKYGDYTLSVSATDSSGNKAKTNFKLIVKENKNVTVSTSSKNYTIKNDSGVTYISNVIVVNKSYSLPSSFAPNNLVSVNGYIKVVDFVKDAFNELKSDATSIGLNLYASSGYRSYKDQDYIYNNYVKRDGVEKADTYSARAGYSEHQTGLAIDLNTIDMTFDNTSESNWLKDNCYKYGFIIRYPKDKDSITGYMYEPWHIRYVGKELAEKLYNNGTWLTIEEYFGIDSVYK